MRGREEREICAICHSLTIFIYYYYLDLINLVEKVTIYMLLNQYIIKLHLKTCLAILI
jgi:hypothetical protein